MTRGRLALWLVGAPTTLLALSWLAMGFLLGHNFYVVRGTARLRPDAARAARFPALFCVGKGGPLETSGVSAVPLGFEQDQPHAYVLCKNPASDLSVHYAASVYTNMRPRRMHTYVWLEHHPELEASCSGEAERADVPPTLVAGYGSQDPKDWPCRKPRRDAVLGYAIAFVDLLSGTEQHADIALMPNGYPSSRSTPR